MPEQVQAVTLMKPRPIEVLAGSFLGFNPPIGSLEQQLVSNGPGASPRAMFEQAVLRGLQRPPCVIGFSGGRDSSAVLATAVSVARREGLELPVPFTERYPDAPTTHEDEWQERVVSYLGLKDWARLELRSEFDVVGAAARRFMSRHGVTLGHLQKSEVLFGQARGGCYMDGEGGDEILGFRRATAARRALTRPWALIRPRAVRWLKFHLDLKPSRLEHWRQYYSSRLESRRWLKTQAFEQVLEALAAELSDEPLEARRSLWHHLSRRRVLALRHNRQLLASTEYEATYIQPFLEPEFVAAWARRAGLLGLRDRTACMKDLFGDLLPNVVLERITKASFNTVFLGLETRAFAQSWTGSGLDEDLVDPSALREEWLSDLPSNLSSGLLQEAWLAAAGGVTQGKSAWT